FQDGPANSTGRFSGSGAALGVTAGYNWQAPASPFVLGVEANYSWVGLRAATETSPTFGCNDGCRARLNHEITLRGRL
ncbi:outer membrane protein, partial [Enterobacter hormaechei]|uniref:outer membrane protein n=1 Tax=Enterobacter hormaechei TaxID=158836 RepID=UPI00195349EE